MHFKIKRLILFVKDVPAQSKFYRDVFGLKIKGDPSDKDWIELATGGISIGLHSGGKLNEAARPAKIVFFSDDVEAARTELIKRGVKMGKVMSSGSMQMCDGRDPEGNPFQISNRS